MTYRGPLNKLTNSSNSITVEIYLIGGIKSFIFTPKFVSTERIIIGGCIRDKAPKN